MKKNELVTVLSDNSETLGIRIREALANRRMSRQQLADQARISLSTLEKALNGSRPFTLATIVRLENALGVSLRPHAAVPPDAGEARQAPAHLGAYARAAVDWLEGDYLTLRPSFEAKDAIYAYCTTIKWDAGSSCLVFQEAERLDAEFSQKGEVSIPSKSGHIYLHTNEDGQFRLAILGRPSISGQMYGILTTLIAGSGTQLLPASTPLVLIPIASDRPEFGRITSGVKAYSAYRAQLLRCVEREFIRQISV